MSLHRIGSILLIGMVVGGLSPAAFGQRFEFGGGAGASFYNKRTVSGPAVNAEARFKPGYGFTGYVGQRGQRLGGELRYSYSANGMELASGGKSFSMSGRTQAIHYDLSFYFNRSKASVRPYLLAGGGMKQYSATGTTVAVQPFMATVVLTNTSEWKPLITAGAGVRFALSSKLHLRAEVLTFITQTPTKVITPVNGELKGWYFDTMPMLTLSYVW